MRFLLPLPLLCTLALLLAAPAHAQTTSGRPLLLISVDGLRPADVLDAQQHCPLKAYFLLRGESGAQFDFERLAIDAFSPRVLTPWSAIQPNDKRAPSLLDALCPFLLLAKPTPKENARLLATV